ncbi:MAG: YraN family protein [Pseudomonadota bacterium]
MARNDTQLSFDFDRPTAAQAADTARRLKGRVAYLSGISAENHIASDYERRGYRILHRRWRGQAGEVDLIAQGGAQIVFVEVKQSRDFDRAARALSQRQVARIYAAAEEFAGTLPSGQGTDMRLDVALLNGYGETRVLENVSAYG